MAVGGQGQPRSEARAAGPGQHPQGRPVHQKVTPAQIYAQLPQGTRHEVRIRRSYIEKNNILTHIKYIAIYYIRDPHILPMTMPIAEGLPLCDILRTGPHILPVTMPIAEGLRYRLCQGSEDSILNAYSIRTTQTRRPFSHTYSWTDNEQAVLYCQCSFKHPMLNRADLPKWHLSTFLRIAESRWQP
jgi:hypothetical protein